VEVVFETPVIFLAHPKNERGPIIGRQIHYINGSPESYRDTRVLQPSDQKRVDEQATARVHTADDERASWVTLLSALQREESESRKWDEDMRNKTPPPAAAGNLPKAPEYLLAVGLQSKTRSWDFMPSAITRPYVSEFSLLKISESSYLTSYLLLRVLQLMRHYLYSRIFLIMHLLTLKFT